MAGRKRAASLEERLAKIRTSDPEESPANVETPESSESVPAPPEPPDTPEPESEAPALLFSFGSISQPADPAPVPTPDNPVLGAAAEGDTFLPGAAANRVDVGIAVQAAVAELLPEVEATDLPAELQSSPEETPLLSKLLGRGRMSARRPTQERRDGPGATPPNEPAEDAQPAPDAEPIAEEPTTGEVSELAEIIAEIAEITEVAPPAEWIPMRAPVPKPEPLEQREPEPGPEPVVDEVIEAIVVEEPEFDTAEPAEVDEIVTEAQAESPEAPEEPAEAAALPIDDPDEGPIVGLVNALMSQAITDHASDLHIEPCSTHIAIRMRIDGVLHDSSTVPLELLRPVVSRVKILAGLDIAQNRLAQDGRFSLTIDGRSIDVRAVTMPTAAGEAVILRLLDPVREALGLSSLGLSPAEEARFLPAFTASQGAVFIAGPTGSGKTSSIYAVLSQVNTRTKSIVSIEDPVEFRLDGIKQMQLNPRAGLTFPTALPTVLRSGPDVVFIGEVRDTETARIAADAAITGHLVLSTLHATRAASAPMRLVEMGVEPYLVASALTLVASQRLARRLCELCAGPADDATIEQLRALGTEDALLSGATVRRAVGCAECRGTGYRGRLAVFEIMPVTEGISRLILDRAPRAQIEDLAVEEGMDTMLRAAVKRVVRGDLSVEEMLRVIS